MPVVVHLTKSKNNIMDQLVNYVTEKTGLNREQAQSAAQAVVTFIKEKLPAGMASQLDGIVGGSTTGGTTGSAPSGGMGDIGGKIGGMFGNK